MKRTLPNTSSMSSKTLAKDRWAARGAPPSGSRKKITVPSSISAEVAADITNTHGIP